MSKPTIGNLYKKFVNFTVWSDEDREEWDTYDAGFTMNYSDKDYDEKTNDTLFRMMYDEIRGNLQNTKKKSLMWCEKVKQLSNWKKGEIIYGYSRERHNDFNIWFSKNKENIGYSTFIIDVEGYIALVYNNQYTLKETEDIKNSVYIRPDSLYNDKMLKENQKK
jgi:hypothetical protein